MRVATDATALTLLINPEGSTPIDPATEKPVTDASERIKHFIAQIDEASGQVIIPTPALAEALVKAGDAGPEIMNLMQSSGRFLIADFDRRAALEVASMTREALMAGDKSGGSTAAWQKVKFDRQIIAIAKVNRADVLFSDDKNVGKFAERVKLKVLRSWELPRPPQPQPDLFDPSRAAAIEEAVAQASADEPGNEEPDAPVDDAATTPPQVDGLKGAAPDPTFGETSVPNSDDSLGNAPDTLAAPLVVVVDPMPSSQHSPDKGQVGADGSQPLRSNEDE